MTQQDYNISMAAVPEMTAQMMVALGRVEEKQDTLLTSQNKFEVRIMDKHYKVEGRVTVLEKELSQERAARALIEAENKSLREALKELKETTEAGDKNLKEVIATEITNVKKEIPVKAKIGATALTLLTVLAAIMSITMVFANLNVMEKTKQQQSIEFEILKKNQKEIAENVEK